MPDSNSFTELAALISSHMPQGALESVNHEAIVAVEQTIHQSGRPELLRAYYSLLADIDTPVLPASSVDTRRPISALKEPCASPAMYRVYQLLERVMRLGVHSTMNTPEWRAIRSPTTEHAYDDTSPKQKTYRRR
jgi:hypothetical protein